MKVAVSVNEEEQIAPHLGRCKIFYIFEVKEEIQFMEMRVTDGKYHNHRIHAVMDCDAVISGQIGDGMKENLRELGIEPIVEWEESNPLKALAKLKKAAV